jgi:hypothetical protein
MQNYCEITVLGQKVGLKFGLPSVRQIAEKSIKYGLSNGRDEFNELGYAHILYAGYCNNNLAKEISGPLTLEDFIDHVENCTVSNQFDEIIMALNTFQNSKTVENLAAVGRELQENKKKLAAKKSPIRKARKKRK